MNNTIVRVLLLWGVFTLFICADSFCQDYVVSSKSTLNVRSGPGSEYEVIGTLNNNAPVYVEQSLGEWSKINYNSQEGYVSTKFLQPAPSKASSSKGSSSSGSYKGNFIEKMFYSLSKGGFFGGLVLYLIIPIIIYFLCIYIPLYLFALIRFLPNWIFYILSFIIAFFIMMPLVGWFSDQPGFYGNTFAFLWAWLLYILIALAIIKGIVNDRCPTCHRMENNIIDRYSETKKWTEVEKTYTAGGTLIDEKRTPRSETHSQSKRKCMYCGSQWWSHD